MSLLCLLLCGCHDSGPPGRSDSARSPRPGGPVCQDKGSQPGIISLPAKRVLSHLGSVGDRRLSAEWGGHGAAAGGGGGGPGPPLCCRGCGSRVRRWDEVALPVGKSGKAGVFRAPRPCTKPPPQERKAAVVSPPQHLRSLRPTLSLLPSRVTRGEGIVSKAQPGREFLPRESRAYRGCRLRGREPTLGGVCAACLRASLRPRVVHREQLGPATPHRHFQRHPTRASLCLSGYPANPPRSRSSLLRSRRRCHLHGSCGRRTRGTEPSGPVSGRCVTYGVLARTSTRNSTAINFEAVLGGTGIRPRSPGCAAGSGSVRHLHPRTGTRRADAWQLLGPVCTF